MPFGLCLFRCKMPQLLGYPSPPGVHGKRGGGMQVLEFKGQSRATQSLIHWARACEKGARARAPPPPLPLIPPPALPALMS